MTFPAYPNYRNSGVEWLGAVPTHWESWKISHAFGELGSGTTPPTSETEWYENGTVPWVTTGELRETVIWETKKLLSSTALSAFSALRLHPAGSLAIAMYGATIGRLGILGVDATTNQACCLLTRPNHLHVKFTFYWLFVFKKSIIDLYASGGGQPNINQEIIANLKVPAPGVGEQTQIARFLDHETARIDTLIEEQQRLIELLKEKRQAVISHAVTKGLDPTVPMKDSGVEWLGEVPTHWDVARVKNIAKLESGHTPSKEYPEYWEGGDIPWVSLNDSKQLKVVDYINETQYMITALGMNNSSARLLPARAVVFTRDATIGLAAITTRKMCVSQHLIAWICIETLMLPEYLLLVFYAMEEELGRFTFGATLKTIGMPDVRKLTTTVPPLTEQAEIVAEVNSKRDLISRLISEGENGIALLQERRSALISAAVTGKIDIRSWQPPASATSPELAQEAV